jgi:hypothetical protein
VGGEDPGNNTHQDIDLNYTLDRVWDTFSEDSTLNTPSWVSVMIASSTLVLTLTGLLMIFLAAGAIYLYGWRKPPEVSLGTSTTTEANSSEGFVVQRGGTMYESEVPEAETESVEHDAFDPVGTALLLAAYALVIALAWIFMYFVEFLGNGPTVVG